MSKPKSIGLFGSSFNPPHIGHFEVLKNLSEKNLFEEIWLLPVFKHPFRKDLWPYEWRLKLAKLLLKDLDQTRIKISEIEKELGKNPSYMFDTVMALKQRHPDFHFTLILGSDCKKDLPRWHRYENLKTEVDFYFMPRKGYEQSPFAEVSSREIRERLQKGQPIDGMTTKAIAELLEIYARTKKNQKNCPHL